MDETEAALKLGASRLTGDVMHDPGRPIADVVHTLKDTLQHRLDEARTLVECTN